LEQIRAALEARTDRPDQTRQAFDGRGELAGRDAGLLIEGSLPVAAPAAIIAGPPVAEGADETDDGTVAVGVVAGGLLTIRTGYTGALVAVFF
jgi:hypothetical protein